MLETRYTISIDLREPPGAGKAQIVFRGTEADRNLITAAAKLLGISINRFMRTVMVQAAHQVLRESDPKEVVPVNNVKFSIGDAMMPPGVKPQRS